LQRINHEGTNRIAVLSLVFIIYVVWHYGIPKQ